MEQSRQQADDGVDKQSASRGLPRPAISMPKQREIMRRKATTATSRHPHLSTVIDNLSGYKHAEAEREMASVRWQAADCAKGTPTAVY